MGPGLRRDDESERESMELKRYVEQTQKAAR
jgi:hypothetical protein